MTNDEIDSPGTGNEERDNFVWSDNKGRLLLISPAKYETGLSTKFSKPGETKDAVRAAIVVLDGPNAGHEYPDELIFGGRLIGQLKVKVGRKVAGRVNQVPTDKGNPAWILDDPTDAEKKTAREWLDKSAVSGPDKPPF